jgi:hypothetical protein
MASRKYLQQMSKKSSLIENKEESALFTIEYGTDRGIFDPNHATRGVSEGVFFKCSMIQTNVSSLFVLNSII